MRKDLGIIMDEAKRNGAIIEIAKIIDGYYAEVQKMGGKRWDTSALIARLNKT
jgi:3-hydroxyisobutyrate dehydrogenase-like beta-hydroxyacid dehydrogenase